MVRLITSTTRSGHAASSLGTSGPLRPPAQSCRAPIGGAGPECIPRAVRRSTVADLPNADRVGDSRGDQFKIISGARGNESHPVREVHSQRPLQHVERAGSCPPHRGRSGLPGVHSSCCRRQVMAATSRSRPMKLVSGTGGGAQRQCRSGNGMRGTCWIWLWSAGVDLATSRSLDGCDNGVFIIL